MREEVSVTETVAEVAARRAQLELAALLKIKLVSAYILIPPGGLVEMEMVTAGSSRGLPCEDEEVRRTAAKRAAGSRCSFSHE